MRHNLKINVIQKLILQGSVRLFQEIHPQGIHQLDCVLHLYKPMDHLFCRSIPILISTTTSITWCQVLASPSGALEVSTKVLAISSSTSSSTRYISISSSRSLNLRKHICSNSKEMINTVIFSASV